MSLVCGSCTEREKASVETAVRGCGSTVGERERAKAETGGTEYRLRRSLADRLVVAVKLPARWGGGGAKGPAHQECRFVQPGPLVLGGSEDEHAKAQGQAVCDSQVDGLGGVPAGCGQQGCPGVDGQALEEFEADLRATSTSSGMCATNAERR